MVKHLLGVAEFGSGDRAFRKVRLVVQVNPGGFKGLPMISPRAAGNALPETVALFNRAVFQNVDRWMRHFPLLSRSA